MYENISDSFRLATNQNIVFRQKKAEDEAQKLHQIKVELSRLDASLSNDVGILRSHIEVASAELTDAE